MAESLLRNIDTLEKRVDDIVDGISAGGRYNENIEKLDNNIYILTELIQDDIQYYILLSDTLYGQGHGYPAGSDQAVYGVQLDRRADHCGCSQRGDDRFRYYTAYQSAEPGYENCPG